MRTAEFVHRWSRGSKCGRPAPRARVWPLRIGWCSRELDRPSLESHRTPWDGIAASTVGVVVALAVSCASLKSDQPGNPREGGGSKRTGASTPEHPKSGDQRAPPPNDMSDRRATTDSHTRKEDSEQLIDEKAKPATRPRVWVSGYPESSARSRWNRRQGTKRPRRSRARSRRRSSPQRPR